MHTGKKPLSTRPQSRFELKTTVITANMARAIGAVLIVAGIVIPSSALVASLRATALSEQLILGGMLFKTGLVLQGLFIMILGWMIAWKVGKQNEKRLSDRYRILASFTLVGMLLTALLLRLYNLNLGIWFDEIATYVNYMGHSLGEIFTTYDNQNNHILYTLFARLSFLIFGESVWSLRFPAVLFGVGSIWAVYLFAREVSTWGEGLLAAGLLTFSYHHVWFSQNARGYTALLFWTLLSSWLLLRALREAKVGLWLMYGITAALGMLSHVTMTFVAVGQGIVYLATVYDATKQNRREMWLGGLVGFAFAGLLTFQFYALVLPQVFHWQGAGVSTWQGKVAVVPWKSPIWMIRELSQVATMGLGSNVLLGLAVLVFGAGLIDFARKKSPVVVLLLVPAMVGLIVIMAAKSTLLPRLFFFTIGFAAIILVRGLMLCGGCLATALRFDPRRKPLIGAGLCACAIVASGISVIKAYQPKQDYRGALDFVQSQRRPGDVVLTVGLAVFPYQRFYKVDWHAVTTLSELDKARSRGTRTWLVYTMPIVLKSANPEVMESIHRDFNLVKEFPGTLNGGSVFVSRAEPSVM